MSAETLTFQAEVAKLLDIVVNALYSQREIFLRELISNASDACDKLRYAALTEPALIAGDADLRITLRLDKDAKTLTIADNGIGMDRDDLINNLGTIARSGTAEFLKGLGGDARKDVSQIGQFGVGFYSAFMVASQVEVHTRKAGGEHGWCWSSDGKGGFTITEDADAPRGARIVLHLKDDAAEFLDVWRLRQVVKTYSDHIGLPVVLLGGEDGTGADETLNQASALWTRSRSEVTEEQYKEFYHHVGHAYDDPWLTVHYRAEGAIEYTGLLFIPTQKPFDLFQPDRKQHVKLYVNRVFITDDCDGLLPPYLRFVRGVVDSADLPLNVSREMLQHNPVLAKIKTGLVKRILSDLKKKAEDTDAYAAFWGTFGAVLKEGLYEDFERRDDLLALARFHSTHGDGLVSLEDYVSRMKDGQDAIYFITGESVAALRKSPQLEGYLAKGVEVLLLTDPIDEFWTGHGLRWKEKAFESVAQGAAKLDAIKAEEQAETPEQAPADQTDALIALLKGTLGERVKDVRVSSRLTASACCLVADEGQMSIHLERLLRQHQGQDAAPARVLEINAGHGTIKALAARAAAETTSPALEDMAFLLFDQARIVEGEAPADPVEFAARLSRLMQAGLV
ncbi:molecular chaperone HtpG [Novispirillum itersonii]|uniref:Chaperone protein HtpG n=1 Tax=Novispirillum itersonii TaxID=189 RepID=A0A7W9ZHF5_NOVIT|nr:molecular chaperone HtpG [Novispirillum itersonii]MBB6211510.1 molecular chaperone HtpG [Novispirillum itersonii]